MSLLDDAVELARWCGWALLAALAVYLVARIISAAVYESRLHYEGRKRHGQGKGKV